MIALLARCPSPHRLKGAGSGHVRTLLKKHAPRLAEKLTEEIFTALAEQMLTFTGTSAADKTIGRLAAQLRQLGTQRAETETEILTVVDAHLLAQVLTSMPGVGVRTAARILTDVVGKTPKTPIAWPPSAGIAPVTRRSRTSIRGESPSRRGNKVLKRALFLSAFASINASPASRAYYDSKRAQSKRHNAADLPGPSPLQRHLRNAARRHLLPGARTRPYYRTGCPRGLTQNIGTNTILRFPEPQSRRISSRGTPTLEPITIRPPKRRNFRAPSAART